MKECRLAFRLLRQTREGRDVRSDGVAIEDLGFNVGHGRVEAGSVET